MIRILLFIVLHVYLLSGQIIDFEGLNPDIVLSSKVVIDGYKFHSGSNNLATNYGDNLDVNGTSLYLYGVGEVQIFKDQKYFNTKSLRAYQVSETLNDTLVVEGYWGNGEILSNKIYNKKFANIDSWTTIDLNYKNINKLVIKINNTLGSNLDYNIDNIILQNILINLDTIGYSGAKIDDYQPAQFISALKFEVPAGKAGQVTEYIIRGESLHSSTGIKFCLGKLNENSFSVLDSSYAVGNINMNEDNFIHVVDGAYLTPGYYWLIWTGLQANYFGFAAKGGLGINSCWTNGYYDYNNFPNSISEAIWDFQTDRVINAVGVVIKKSPLVPIEKSYDMYIENGVQTSDRTFEFDISIKASNLLLVAYQCALTYNNAFGENISFSYINNSSQLGNKPLTNTVKVYNYDGTKKFAFASNVGEDLINSKKIIGRFVITNSIPFNYVVPSIDWSLDGIISTITLDSSFSDATIKGTFHNLEYNIPLPVQLTSFTATIVHDSIWLRWTTATEVNLYGFEIYKTEQNLQTDPPNDSTIHLDGDLAGFVPGHGNSNSSKFYSFIFVPNSSGIYLFKLKIIDTDGSFSYSNLIVVDYIVAGDSIIVKPPVEKETNWLFIVFGGIAAIILTIGIFLRLKKKEN